MRQLNITVIYTKVHLQMKNVSSQAQIQNICVYYFQSTFIHPVGLNHGMIGI